MKKTIVIDPVTRISGFLDIEIQIEENKIVNAKTAGLLFRGFEKMLKGRAMLDSVYFTERICGICSSAHAMAASVALEDALLIKPNLNDLYLRDLIHGFEFLQNHLRQFYLYTMPSYVKFKDLNPITPQEGGDFRLLESLNNRITINYGQAVQLSRLAHEGLGVLGGKAPHNHGIFPGGVTVNIDEYKLIKIKSILDEIYSFTTSYMQEDLYTIVKYYPDYFEKGISYGNFMSFGLFYGEAYKNNEYVAPGIMIKGKRFELDINNITESIKNTWYTRENTVLKAGSNENVEIDLSNDGYTFIKAPRYNKMPFEVGPLARMTIAGLYKGDDSTMDRNIARVLETIKVCKIMSKIVEKIVIKKSEQSIINSPDEAFGKGCIDTTRGALSHFIHIKDGLINNYDIITPSSWNLSPMDENMIHGVAEKALIGLKTKNGIEALEAGRIIRSFDPCVSCATHVIKSELF